MKNTLLFCAALTLLLLLCNDVTAQRLNPEQVNQEYAKIVNANRLHRTKNTTIKADINLFCLTLVRNEYIRTTHDTTSSTHPQSDVEIVGKLAGLRQCRTPRTAAQLIYNDVNRKMRGIQNTSALGYVNASVLGDYYVIRFYTNPGVELLTMGSDAYNQQKQLAEMIMQRVMTVEKGL